MTTTIYTRSRRNRTPRPHVTGAAVKMPQGIVVAGGHGAGSERTHLDEPNSIIETHAHSILMWTRTKYTSSVAGQGCGKNASLCKAVPMSWVYCTLPRHDRPHWDEDHRFQLSLHFEHHDSRVELLEQQRAQRQSAHRDPIRARAAVPIAAVRGELLHSTAVLRDDDAITPSSPEFRTAFASASPRVIHHHRWGTP